MDLVLEVINEGSAVWLARESDGPLGLAWRWGRWHAGGRDAEGFELLRHDVFPGQAYLFVLSVPVPPEPAPHRLDVSLVAAIAGRRYSLADLSLVSIDGQRISMEPGDVQVLQSGHGPDTSRRAGAEPSEPLR